MYRLCLHKTRTGVGIRIAETICLMNVFRRHSAKSPELLFRRKEKKIVK